MNLLKFLFSTVLIIVFLSPSDAQDWVSYQTESQINDLIDTGDELYLATDAGLVVMNKSTLEKSIFNRANSNINNNHIQSITQKSDGTIWIGTYDVVMSRFDGSGFQDVTIPDSDIINQNTELYDFEIAPNGDLWLATDDGVVHRAGQTWVDFEPASIDPLFFEAWNIEISDVGEVYLASNDVYKFDNGNWDKISENTGLQNYLDAEMFLSSTGELYVSGDLDKVWTFDGVDWEGLEFDIDINGSQVTEFTEDTDGTVYVMAMLDGVFKIENDVWTQQDDAQAASFDNRIDFFYIDEQGKHWMNSNLTLSVDDNGNMQTTTISDYTINSNSIYNIEKGANGKMHFMGYFNNEIVVLSEGGEWSYFSNPLPGVNFTFDLLHLSDNDIWVSTEVGAYHYDGIEWTLNTDMQGWYFAIDSQGKIYLAGGEQVSIFDNGVVTEYTSDNSPLSTDLTRYVGVDANDNVWIASYFSNGSESTGAIQRVATDGTWTTWTDTDFPEFSFPDGDFLFDLDGNVWIPGAIVGAMMYDGTTWTNPVRDNSSQVENTDVHDIAMDLNGKLYFSHQYGVTTMFDGEWDNLIIPDIDVPNIATSSSSSLAFDNEGTIWWASTWHGVFAYATGITSSVETNIEQESDFSIYPNPATDYTILDFTTQESATVNVLIYNTLGQLQSSSNLGRFSVGTFQERIDLSRLPKGVYNVQLEVNGKSTTKRIILQ